MSHRWRKALGKRVRWQPLCNLAKVVTLSRPMLSLILSIVALVATGLAAYVNFRALSQLRADKPSNRVQMEHGARIADLEHAYEGLMERTARWVKQENMATAREVRQSRIRQREQLVDEALELVNQTKANPPPPPAFRAGSSVEFERA